MSIIIDESKEIIKNIDFNQIRNTKILITGASGLIGVYLVSCLKQIMKTHNISIFVWIKNDIDIIFSEIFDECTIIQDDITNIHSFSKLPKFDCIIHAAGYGQPDKFMDDKIKTISINTTSTIELFNKLKTNGKFLFISTSEIYSGIDEQNIQETQIGTTNTNHPRACYIEGKRCGESICNIYKEKGYDVKIIRLSLAYGPGTKKNDKRVLNSLIEKGLNNDNIKLMDSGDAIRTYCYITDVIEMFWNIFLLGGDLIYNVGGKSVTSIYDLSVLIGDKLNRSVIIPTEIKQQEGNPKIVNISIEKYINEFKKNNFISLEDGLNKTINWQKKLYNE
jgi:nucleoside-diphosphate-sugar epimerase